MLDLVFVYGTLRRGEVNHHLLKDAALLGEHVTPPRYKMLNLGAYPGVVDGGSTAIVGEIYRITQKQFTDLDRLEAYPKLYGRRKIRSPWGRAWIYLYLGNRRNRAVIADGNWSGKGRRLGPFSL
jgi:gamma-glutamylaminecyclotransferase